MRNPQGWPLSIISGRTFALLEDSQPASIVQLAYQSDTYQLLARDAFLVVAWKATILALNAWRSLQNAQGMQLAIETQDRGFAWVKTLIDGFCQSFLACLEDKSLFKSLSEPWFVCRKPSVVSVASLQDCVRTQNRQPFFWPPHLYAPRDGKSTTPCIVVCSSLQTWFDTLIPLQPRVWDTICNCNVSIEDQVIVTRTNPLLAIACIHPKSVVCLPVISRIQYNRLLW